ncbi:MAG: glutaredoxin family protein [Burkholderiaceae bacterium]|nr:glutaredoxin family protein [Burkholderiaceae bacterium]
MPHFILYSRSWCHLCDDLLQALRGLVGERFRIDIIDVDADPALVERYDELVPVLVGCLPEEPDEQICNYFLDENAVRGFLSRAAGRAGILPAESGKMRD